MLKFPFFFVIDDGGFDCALAPQKIGPVGLDIYRNIARLGKDFGVKIPVCFTLKYLDVKKISEFATPLPYAGELVSLLKENSSFIEIGYHGLTHEGVDGEAEFLSLIKNAHVPEQVQQSHISASAKIFESWGLQFPEIFVPPYNAWEPGVTDRLVAGVGGRYLIGVRGFSCNGHKYRWNSSEFIAFLPRTGVGLTGSDYNISEATTRKIPFYPRKTISDFMQSHVIPQGLVTRLRFSKKFSLDPVHSYMTHIGNFSKGAMPVWYKIFEWAMSNSSLVVCRDNKEAVSCYRHLLNGGLNDLG
jgi:hypothetical protein